jgi:hypothetical protein
MFGVGAVEQKFPLYCSTIAREEPASPIGSVVINGLAFNGKDEIVSRLFECYLVVDWSARSTPSARHPEQDAIWVGEALAPGMEDGHQMFA